jgi:type II secretory pathway component PulF
MPVYSCRVADGKGRIGEFLREAASEESCLRELAAGHAHVLALEELPAVAVERRRPRCPRRLLEDLTGMLALTLASGLSLRDALEAAQSVYPRGAGNALVAILRERLARGGSFSEALAAAATGLPALYTGMVRVGERIGSLEQSFAILAAHLKRERVLRDRFSSALVYPAVVLSVAVASAVFIVVVLFPRLRELFAELGPASGSTPETLLAGLATWLAGAGIALGCLAALGVVLAIARRRGGDLAVGIDRLLLSIPLVSAYVRRREILGLVFAMESLTGAGVSVEEALGEAAGTLGNRALAREVLAVRARLLVGGRLSEAFSASPLFPERIARWMAIGERTGRVERVFAQLRATCEQEVQAWIERLAALVEPALILGLGILVVAFVAFFIVPVFSLFGAVI